MTNQPETHGQRVRRLAELVTSLAVLVTLLLLVVELRQNTAATRAASFAQTMEGLTTWRLAMAGDVELARVWDEYVAGSESEDPRLGFLISAVWGIYENAYYSWQRGLIGESEWTRFERLICQRRDRALERSLRNLLTSEFVDYAESACGG